MRPTNEHIANYEAFLSSGKNVNNVVFLDALGDNYLDCGSSYGSQYLAHPEGWHGAEINQDCVDYCRERFDIQTTFCPSYLELPFADKTFKLATSRSMLNHYNYKEARAIMNEMLRVADKILIKLVVQPHSCIELEWLRDNDSMYEWPVQVFDSYSTEYLSPLVVLIHGYN